MELQVQETLSSWGHVILKCLDRSCANQSLGLPKGSFLYCRWSQLCEVRLLLVVTRLIVIIEYPCFRGHPDTDLVYIIITAHMDVKDGPFNKPLGG